MNLDIKQRIDDYITNNNHQIEGWICNSIKSKRKSVYKLSGALLSELYLYIYENPEKVYNKYLIQSNDVMKGFILFYCHIQLNYNSSTFYNTLKLNADHLKEFDSSLYAEYDAFLIDDDSKEEKEFIQQQKLNALYNNLGTLTLAESIFYNMYYVQNKSIRDIAKEINENPTNVFNIKQNVDKKILLGMEKEKKEKKKNKK